MKKKVVNKIDFSTLSEALDLVDAFIAIKNLNGDYVYANKSLSDYFKSRFDSIIGLNYADIYPDYEQVVVKQLDDEVIYEGKPISKTIKVLTDDGYIFVDSTRAPLRDSEGNIIGVISSGKNVSEREFTKQKLEDTINELKEMNKRYFQMAYIDPLSGIGNRRKFYEDFKKLDILSNMTLVLFDINNFKSINDTMGHLKGDEVIIQFSKMIDSISNKFGGSAYRLGGDEFALVINQPFDVLNDEIYQLNQYLKNVSRVCSVSYGFSVVAKDIRRKPDYMDVCIKEADIMMYQKKENLKSKVLL